MADQLISISLPGPELKAEAANTLAQAKSYVITSPEMYEAAAEDLREIVGKKKALDERRKTITKPLDEAKSAVMDLFREPLSFLEQAEKVLKLGIRDWDIEQDRIRREREAAAAELLRKEREAIEKKADKVEAKGKTEEAVALRAQAEMMPQSVTLPPTEVAKGVSYRTTWSAEVTDLMALVKAVAAGEVPLAAVEANTKFLGAQARSLQAEMKYPGVKVKSEKTVAARSS